MDNCDYRLIRPVIWGENWKKQDIGYIHDDYAGHYARNHGEDLPLPLQSKRFLGPQNNVNAKYGHEFGEELHKSLKNSATAHRYAQKGDRTCNSTGEEPEEKVREHHRYAQGIKLEINEQRERNLKPRHLECHI